MCGPPRTSTGCFRLTGAPVHSPLRPISHTASEIIAGRVVARLYRQPPKGMSWRDFAIYEIALALRAAALERPRRDP
jgi:hypothetical protein